MKSYIQLANLANTYYDIWTEDGIDAFHADATEVAAWLKREDLRTDADTELDDLTDNEIERIASMIADMVNDELIGEVPAKKWFYIEDCTSKKSAVYSEPLKAENATEAFIEASSKWNALTESDRSKRDEAYIGYADMNEDGYVDYDTMTDIYYIKRNKSTVYYILDDYNGYGSEHPYCSDAVETAELLEGWNYSGDDPLTEFWHEASRSEIEYNGTYDGTTGTSRPGKREEEED